MCMGYVATKPMHAAAIATIGCTIPDMLHLLLGRQAPNISNPDCVWQNEHTLAMANIKA